MGRAFAIIYDERVIRRDLAGLDRTILLRVRAAIEKKLVSRPDVYGKPLRGPLHGIWSLRVGEYRIAYRIVKQAVYIDVIEHRSVIYAIALSRYNAKKPPNIELGITS